MSLIIFIAWLSTTGYGNAANQIVNSRQLSYQPVRLPAGNGNTEVQSKSGVKRILALRVEFVVDTLATTTGDGTFDYGSDDTLYFDPPPHDSMFFADNLEFLRFYWEKMSDGDIDIEYDIYPPRAQASYQLPRQMWQYNYNQSDEQLDIGLAQLFYDSVIAANETGDITNWDDYDLVVVFHAGAGAEFDLGYTTTPHDLPSAWMTGEDLEVIDVFGGVPVDGGSPVMGGIILPETETHEGVQISMAGVICSLFGHWLGLPALYDRDDGGVVVGKWSLMDRGFGNFFGAIPGQVDAWSRSYMGWLEPEIIEPSGISTAFNIASLGFENDTIPQGYMIPLNAHESFIISCRNRDPEQDSIAIAFDRDGRKMVFNEDYSVDADPGFRVPVRIDNLDFDAPGSGILIWHVDESKRELIREGRFNSVDSQRGLDLEEADGAQDIGEDYPFLTPGYGTDYGVFFDAWYSDNEFHKEANDGRQVSFNDKSFPDAHTKIGANSSVVIDKFSRRDTVMSFEFSQTGLMFSHWFASNSYSDDVVIGNFDADVTDQEIAIISDSLTIYDGDGSILEIVDIPHESASFTDPIVIDYTNDGVDDIVWRTDWALGRTLDHLMIYGFTPNTNQHELQLISAIDIPNTGIPNFEYCVSRISDFGISLVYTYRDGIDSAITVVAKGLDHEYQREFEINGEYLSLYRMGNEFSKDILILSKFGAIPSGTDNDLYHLMFNESDNTYEMNHLGNVSDSIQDYENIAGGIVADFDGSGEMDLLMLNVVPDDSITFGIRVNNTLLIKDVLVNGLSDIEIFDEIDNFRGYIPVDIDHDGQYEVLGYNDGQIVAYEYNGMIADGYPISLKSMSSSEDSYIGERAMLKVANLSGNRDWEFFIEEKISHDDFFRYSSGQVLGLNNKGRLLQGFPLSTMDSFVSVRFAQLNDEPDLEMVIATPGLVYAYDPGFTGEMSDIWWGQPYRDNLHSNAVWEAAEPFSPSGSSGLLIDSECYNWPNPASGSTAIRYALNFAADVKVDIYDITGERVLTLHDSGMPGLPNEINWDLSNIPRGGYIAMLKANGSGRSDSKKIKIAVVK